MKLALIAERFDCHGGGAERSCAQIAEHLVARGHGVTVLAGYSPGDGGVQGVGIECFSQHRPRFALPLLRFSRWAQRRLTAGNYDSALSITMAVPAPVLQPRGGTVRETLERNIALRGTPGRRLVKRLLVNLSPKQRMLLSLESRTLRSPVVRTVAALSGYVADQLRTHYRLDPGKIELIPNASDLQIPDESQRVEWRRRVREGFRVPEGPVVFLFAAYNPRLKGADTLLRAAKMLNDRGVEFTLLLAGNIGYAQQHMAAELGIRDRVRIVSTTNRMAELYAASDVTVLPTFYDPSSKVVIESLMMGVPAISTLYNGASDLIMGGEGGVARGRVIEDPGDAESLARAMQEIADPETRRICASATGGLAEDLSMSRHVDRLEVLLAGSRVSGG